MPLKTPRVSWARIVKFLEDPQNDEFPLAIVTKGGRVEFMKYVPITAARNLLAACMDH